MRGDQPLAGLRVGVTSARRGSELCTALQRRGASTLWGPTLQPDVPTSDPVLIAETDAVLAAAPSLVAASTGVGMRAWVEAADRHGRGCALRELLRSATVAARGAKALGALRCLDVTPAFVSPKETDEDVATWLARQVRPDTTVAAQLHGAATEDDAFRPIEALGIKVLRTRPYRCDPPADTGPAAQLIDEAVCGRLDVVVATSAPAVDNLFAIAADLGQHAALVASLQGPVAAAAVGAVTAAAFERVGVGVALTPTRARTGQLLASLECWAARRSVETSGGGLVELLPAERAARTAHTTVALTAREFAVLAALVRRPDVVCPAELLALEAWGHAAPDDPRQVKHHIAALRRKLGDSGDVIRTVRGVGYRYQPCP